jgi:2-polyprenyl-3-methyl-5-hydroxy-6-metoxy-1,4-benzoquinol methylase
MRGPCDFFDQRTIAPLIAGKRVLDLGSNNPSLPVTMLRAGAREVVAVEFMPPAVEVSGPNARILSWRDVHPYDIQVLSGDMRLFLTEDLGSFDVVTALCSLSFLQEPDMARIVHTAASMNAVLILQANDEIDSLPAKTLDLHRLMRDNGYPEVQVHTREGITQPLLVGFTWIGAKKGPTDAAQGRLGNH